MNLELNLLENSYDYIEETLFYYKKIGLDEYHDKERSGPEEKKKWKTAFILLVQAIELLIKEALKRINPVLIYEDIDDVILKESKTISYSKSIVRLKNLKPNLLSDKEIKLLNNVGNIRNNFIHYNVKFNSIDLKKKYCKTFELYIKLHYKIIRKKYQNNVYKYETKDILEKAKSLEIFRGMEFSKQELKKYKQDLADNQNMPYVINSNNETYKRLKYGEEYKFYKSASKKWIIRTYCPDCAVKKGEYHLDNCDWEICPKCGNQIISCDCDWKQYTSENDKMGKNIII